MKKPKATWKRQIGDNFEIVKEKQKKKILLLISGLLVSPVWPLPSSEFQKGASKHWFIFLQARTVKTREVYKMHGGTKDFQKKKKKEGEGGISE